MDGNFVGNDCNPAMMRTVEESRGTKIGIIGWDIGGVNVKASWLPGWKDPDKKLRVTSLPFEIWRDKSGLVQVLKEAYEDLCPDTQPGAMAVTMSAELSDVFASKREGVLFVVECVRDFFPDTAIHFMDVSGAFSTLEHVRERPLEFAASNWVASAQWIARKRPSCLLVDVGSTTTDIIPILEGEICAKGRTDTARLQSGELVYSGVLRTNLAAIVQSIPISGKPCRIASEYFTISGDVHLILGNIRPEEYSCPTPDNRPPTVASARRRLARLVCADEETLSAPEIDAMARYIYTQQVLQIRSGIEQVVAARPELRSHPVVVHGAGTFLGRDAVEGVGLKQLLEESDLSPAESATLPCLSVAYLLASELKETP
ncbi:MAG: hydantoinase/oxoprolinase family protein [Acidobacteriota bacterium]